MKDGTNCAVSFGMVQTLEYDINAVLSTSAHNQKQQLLSLEDYERSRSSPKPRVKEHYKRRMVQASSRIRSYQNDRALRLAKLQCEIEDTICAADSIVNQDTCLDSMLASMKTKQGKHVITSFPPPGAPKVAKGPRTQSLSRISSLHLSKLDLNEDAHERSPFMVGSTKNADFDTTPKRPTRKRSNECLVHQRFQQVLEGKPTATWETSQETGERPKKKRSMDCLLKNSFLEKEEKAFGSGFKNATWRVALLPNSPRNL